jgi:predicted nucleotidyltransferase
MNRNAIVAAIQSEEAALKRVGVKSLALVGSTARDTRTEASDVDVLTCWATRYVCPSMSAAAIP